MTIKQVTSCDQSIKDIKKALLPRPIIMRREKLFGEGDNTRHDFMSANQRKTKDLLGRKYYKSLKEDLLQQEVENRLNWHT